MYTHIRSTQPTLQVLINVVDEDILEVANQCLSELDIMIIQIYMAQTGRKRKIRLFMRDCPEIMQCWYMRDVTHTKESQNSFPPTVPSSNGHLARCVD